MKKILVLTAITSMGVGLSAQLPLDRPTFNEVSKQMWSDPAFIKSFVGSYAPLENVEPEFSNDEKVQLKDVVAPLLSGPTQSAAIPPLEKLAANSSATAGVHFVLGTLYLQEDRMAQAEAQYVEAVKKFPRYRKALKNLSLIYMQQGNYKKALDPLSKTIDLGEVSGNAYGMLGVIHLYTEDYVAAESAYRMAVMLEPSKKDWKLGLLKAMQMQERFKEANVLLNSLLQEDPNNVDYWLFQANNYVGLERPLDAAKNLEIVERMGRAKADSVELLANIYMNSGLYDVAYSAYQRAMEKGDAKYENMYRAATALAQVGSFNEAIELVGKIRQRFPRDIQTADNIQLLVLEARSKRALGDSEGAAVILEKVVEEDPMNGQALIELALYYRNRTPEPDYQKAVFLFERAENIREVAADAYVQHAQLLVAQRKFKDAVPLLKNAQSINFREYVEDFLVRVQRAAAVL